MSEYICSNKLNTNECPNIFVKEKLIQTNDRIYIRDKYIRIFEYLNIFVTLWFRTQIYFGLCATWISQWEIPHSTCVIVFSSLIIWILYLQMFWGLFLLAGGYCGVKNIFCVFFQGRRTKYVRWSRIVLVPQSGRFEICFPNWPPTCQMISWKYPGRLKTQISTSFGPHSDFEK